MTRLEAACPLSGGTMTVATEGEPIRAVTEDARRGFQQKGHDDDARAVVARWEASNG